MIHLSQRVRRSLLAVAVAVLAAPAAHAVTVHVARIDGSINPASADYLIGAIGRAEAEGGDALLVELDTPGGLVSSMKDMLDAVLNADLPVIVYVAPRGAWAGSAGVFLTMSAHVAAMAPGTTIGAAHPVGIGPANPAPPAPEGDGENEGAPPAARDYGMEKAENMLAAYAESIAKQRGRNVEWAAEAVRNSVAIGEAEALEKRVVDVVAQDRADLFAQIEGREVEVNGEPRTLALENARFVEIEMTPVQRLFNFLSEPNIAVILGALAFLGLYIEFNNPGMIVPGAIGVVCLVLAALAFQILPFSWIGLILIVTGIGLLIAEIFVTSFGLLFTAGLLCLLAGGAMVFDRPDVSTLNVSFWTVLVPAVAGIAVFGGIAVFALSRSLWTAQTAGVDELIGLVGKASTAVGDSGKVFVRGEYWNATSEEPIAPGEAVEITGVRGLSIQVRRAHKS